MKWLRSGLFRKVALVMIVLALVPVTYLALQLSGITQRGIQGAVLELHTKLAEKLAEQIENYFKVNNEKLSFALLSIRKEMPWADKQELLRGLIDTHPDIIEISIVNSEGRELVKVYNPELSSEEVLVSRAEEAGFKRFIETRQRVTTILSEKAALEIYYPVNKAVMARIGVSLRGLSARIAAERVGGTGFAILVDKAGEPLFYSEDHLPEALRRGVAQWPIVAAALHAQTVGSSEFSDPAGKQMVGAYAPVLAIGGAIVILQSRDEAYLAADQMKRTSILVLSIVLCLSLAGATITARKLTAPLITLTKGAEAVSRGDFTVQVAIRTGDELQDLAETFNHMTAQLRSYSEMQIDRILAEQRKTGAILFSIDEGILLTDTAGKIQHANRRALEYMKLSPTLSIEGKTIEEVLPDSPLREALVATGADSKPGAFKEVDLANDKIHLYLKVSSHPVVSPGTSAVWGKIFALRDITLEKNLDKMKEEFLHYITHDLRNPLGSAMGFIEVLLKGLVGVLNPEQHNMVSSIQRSTSRLMGMINNILDIAKMESGKLRLNLQNISLTGIACRSIGILESLSQQKKIKVVLAAPEEFSLQGDADHLERVFTNLLGNAIKYTPVGGTITVSVEDQGSILRCGVSDSGEGIPEAYLSRIFEKFEQVTGQRKGGTGLGLTITKFFVEAHLGKIWVESVVGKGSQFFFTIPKGLALDEEGGVEIKKKPTEPERIEEPA